jgi:hypothetical protein
VTLSDLKDSDDENEEASKKPIEKHVVTPEDYENVKIPEDIKEKIKDWKCSMAAINR